MTGAFGYLIVTSARNTLRARIARLRNPRYAIALLLGATYIWAIYLRPSAHPTPRAADLIDPAAAGLLPLLPFLFVAWTWIAWAWPASGRGPLPRITALPAGVWLTLLVALIGFGVVRNLPLDPLRALAP